MVPLRDEGTLVGALYLEEAGAFDEAGVGASLLTLTKAVGSRDHVENLATYLPAVPADEILREQMLRGAGPQRVEHLEGRAYPWRGATDRVPAAGALRHPSEASAQDAELMEPHDKHCSRSSSWRRS